jgi:hypothetical protein
MSTVTKYEATGDYKIITIRETTTTNEVDTHHRRIIAPCTKTGDTWADTDISSETSEVQALANAEWTDSVKTAYKNHFDAVEAEIS